VTAAAAPRSPTRPCAFCGGPVTPNRPAVADRPPLPQLVGDGYPLPEGNQVHDDTPTEPLGRVTVTRQRVTPTRPRVHPQYREWLNTPPETAIPSDPQAGLFLISLFFLTACLAAILVVLFQ
jgi:hypothetical protein